MKISFLLLTIVRIINFKMNSQNQIGSGLYLDNLGYGDVQQELCQAASVELSMFSSMFLFFMS